MKKSLLKLFFNFLIFAVLQVCFFSCQNFLKGTDLKESIDEKIESSKRITIKPEFNEEEGRIRINNKDVQVGQEIELTFLPTEHYIFLNWVYDKEYLEFENANSEHTFATVKKYATEIKIEGICILRNESDHEKPVIKVFRVGLTKESVMSESGKHFATDDGILTATEIDRSQIIGAKEDNKVWVYCELEDNRTIAKASLKEYFIQDNKGRDFDIHADIPIEIEKNDGKVSLLFEHTLKTDAQGIYKFGIGDVFDENNNKADSYLKANEEDSDGKQYYCARHTFYDLQSQGQILSSKHENRDDNSGIYIRVEKEFITKNCKSSVDVKFELGVNSKNYEYTWNYDDVKELWNEKNSSATKDYYLIDLKNFSYVANLFFRVTVKDSLNTEKVFETYRTSSTTRLYNAKMAWPSDYSQKAYGDVSPMFIETPEITPLAYPYKDETVSELSRGFNCWSIYNKKSDFKLDDYFEIEEGETFSGITTITIKSSVGALRSLFGNDLEILELDLESGGIIKKTGFTNLKERSNDDILQRKCLVKAGNSLQIKDLRLHNMWVTGKSSNGYDQYANTYWYYSQEISAENSEPYSFTPGWDKKNLRNGYDYQNDDSLKNELALKEMDPTFQYGYVEEPRGTLKKAICYYKPLDEIAIGLEKSMKYTEKNRGYQVSRPYSPLKLIEYGFIKKEDVYNWNKIGLSWNDKGIKVPLLQFPENQLMEVFIWCEVEDETGKKYDCMDGFQIKRRIVDSKYLKDRLDNGKDFYDFGDTSEYRSYRPANTNLFDMMFSYYIYDKTNKKWPDSAGQNSRRYDYSDPNRKTYISTNDYIGKVNNDSWARLFYINTDAINGVGVDVVTVNPYLRTPKPTKTVTYEYTIKNYIETKRGFICYFDKPTMMETFISDVDHGDDVNAWEKDMYFDKLNSKLITSSLASPESYEVNLDDVKPGQYYTVIIRYSDGETEVTTVHQK